MRFEPPSNVPANADVDAPIGVHCFKPREMLESKCTVLPLNVSCSTSPDSVVALPFTIAAKPASSAAVEM